MPQRLMKDQLVGDKVRILQLEMLSSLQKRAGNRPTKQSSKPMGKWPKSINGRASRLIGELLHELLDVSHQLRSNCDTEHSTITLPVHPIVPRSGSQANEDPDVTWSALSAGC
jgi:hypothetical protein